MVVSIRQPETYVNKVLDYKPHCFFLLEAMARFARRSYYLENGIMRLRKKSGKAAVLFNTNKKPKGYFANGLKIKGQVRTKDSIGLETALILLTRLS